MSEKARRLNEEAARLAARGRFDEACACVEQLVRAEPYDLTARQKLAGLYGRLGRVDDAVRAYQGVAGAYAANGLLLKAIAVCKMILQLDPTHTETQHVLASLTTRRRGAHGSRPTELSPAVEMPGAMSAAVDIVKHRLSGGVHANVSRQDADRKGLAHEVPSMPGAAEHGGGGGLDDAARAVAALRAAPPIPHDDRDAEARLLEEVTLDAAYDDVVVMLGAPLEPSTLAAVIDAATPTLEELRAMTADVGVGGTAVPDTASSAASVAVSNSPAPEGSRTLAIFDASSVQGIDDRAREHVERPPVAGGQADLVRVDVAAIAPIPLFADLPRDAFVALTERMALRVASPGEVLVAEGEPGRAMFVIIQGRVKVTRTEGVGPHARVVELAELADGAFFGEGALLSDAPRTASVVCVENTMLFQISGKLLARMTTEYPSVGDVMRTFHKQRQIANLLKTSAVFAPFSTDEKKLLIERFKSRPVDEGTLLLTREKPGDGLYVLLTGRCEVVDVGPEGREVVVAELKAGDVFGEMSMLWNTATCATVRTATPSVVLRLPRAAFAEALLAHPRLLDSLAALSDRRTRENAGKRGSWSADDFG
jgi:CRP-like cAMP-binding protein